MNSAAITAVVADDEPLLRAQLIDTLAVLWPQLMVAGEAGQCEEAVRLVADKRPQIAFLDIEMPGMNGLQAAAQIEGFAHIVFITAYNQYAVDAFERGAIAYVLKPASEARLTQTFERLKQRVAQPVASEAAPARALAQVAAALRKPNVNRLKWIQASIGNQVRLIPVTDVLFFPSDLKYTRVVTENGESLIRRALKELIDELDPGQFRQIHRSTVVNSHAIAHALREDDKIALVIKGDAERFEVSGTFAHPFKGMSRRFGIIRGCRIFRPAIRPSRSSGTSASTPASRRGTRAGCHLPSAAF